MYQKKQTKIIYMEIIYELNTPKHILFYFFGKEKKYFI
jgi:hypothetical protein